MAGSPESSERTKLDLTARDRFMAAVSFGTPIRGIRWELGYWAGTLRRWYKEGLPARKGVPEWLEDGRTMYAEAGPLDPEDLDPPDAPRRDMDVHRYFGMDDHWWRLPLNPFLCPEFEPKVVEEHADWVLRRSEYGVIVRETRNGQGFPRWEDAQVRSREDWERVKSERLQATVEERLPENWQYLKTVFRNREFPLVIGGYPFGLFASARLLLGAERVLTAFYDDPELLRKIIGHLTELWVTLYDQVLDDVQADACLISEDMCCKHGPLVSPRIFREFFLPGYSKLIACLKDHGISAIILNADGRCTELLPLFVQAGVTCLYPCEAAAGMGVVELRAAFPKLTIMGGIDKRALAKGQAAIDDELRRTALPMLEDPGYIPFVDHSVPPDVSWDSFRYYREKLNALID